MWRAFFLAMGISTCIFGAECLVVDSFQLEDSRRPVEKTAANGIASTVSRERPIRTMKPPEWAPWSLLSSGALVILYSMAMRPGGQ